MAMHRRHAGMVVGDVKFYRKFKADCRNDCTLDEQYTQTLLHCLDPKVSSMFVAELILFCKANFGKGIYRGLCSSCSQNDTLFLIMT
jgi:hypothetical protein